MKGQTSTEYLIILAIVIIIALVVVGVMGGIPRLGLTTTGRTSEAYWQAADIGIVNARFVAPGNGNTTGSFIVKNNKRFKIKILNITLDAIKIADADNTVLSAGKEKTISVVASDGLDAAAGYVAGDTYVYTVVVNYRDEDNNLGPYKFTGEEDLTGEYQ